MSLTCDDVLKLLEKIPDIEKLLNCPINKFQQLAISSLNEGITNDSYKITLDNAHFVLRIDNPNSNRLAINRQNESKILTHVSGLDLASDSIFYSTNHQFRISKWVNGTTWSKKTFEDSAQLLTFINQLKHLHSLRINNLPKMVLSQKITYYRMMLKKEHSSLPALDLTLFKRAQKLISSLQAHTKACLCHNDLVVANILQTNEHQTSKIYFLDWEYAAVNSPFFELAVICRANQLSIFTQKRLLENYFHEDSEQSFQRLQQWCWFYDYLSYLWSLLLDDKVNEADEIKLNRLVDSFPE